MTSFTKELIKAVEAEISLNSADLKNDLARFLAEKLPKETRHSGVWYSFAKTICNFGIEYRQLVIDKMINEKIKKILQ